MSDTLNTPHGGETDSHQTTEPEQDFGEPVRKKNNESRALKIFINLLMVIVLVVLGLMIWQRFFQNKVEAVSPSSMTPVIVTPTETTSSVAGSPQPGVLQPAPEIPQAGILRRTDYHTEIPDRPPQEVITYTVKRDDTLFGIADAYQLKPETILWGNFETLQDNPHLLKPEQVLNILPVNGTYYQWKDHDNLEGVASFFGVDPQAILEFAGNHVDLTEVKGPNSGFKPDQWLIIPGGKRAIKDWGPPAITRKNAAAARYYGDGSCGAAYEGAVGTGTFIWPTAVHSISGYNFSGIHPAIDIAGAIGNAVFASDSGVIVFSGWSNFGYGYLVVLDHGNGYQTAYAHLSAINVGCGQSVFQGSTIGAVGNTGNSAGSHLHFELSYGGAKLNPLENLR